MPAPTPEALHATIAAAVTGGDLEAFVAAYEPDATMVDPPGGEHAHGHEAIRTAMRPILALSPAMSSEVVATVHAGDLALTHAVWALAGTAYDGSAVELAGRGTIVSRRQPDGGWLIVVDNPMSPG